ncbi:hypothetical protein [Deinococcus arcticus]|uniref:Uncharacterized protein n=1 Tax=Deinococcus arcticus TaxID=2136176 RepID=A0A2T3W9E1_9DEIO|nr:hypothetical protein [Deinococcus arcticus]PTA68373.1 hypothetical protein C8263_08005 [Deinococcus arcticus]
MTAPQWRTAALAALWALVAATLALCAYSLWSGWPPSELGWLGALRTLLSAVVLVWWTQVFARYAQALKTEDDDGVLRSLRGLFPWLTALRLALWLMTVFLFAAGAVPEVHLVALTALLMAELGFILAKNAVYGTLARVAPAPLDLAGRAALLSWLNASAALSLAIGVVNVVPVAGLTEARPLADLLVYGLHAALDVTAALLALGAVRRAPRVE